MDYRDGRESGCSKTSAKLLCVWRLDSLEQTLTRRVRRLRRFSVIVVDQPTQNLVAADAAGRWEFLPPIGNLLLQALVGAAFHKILHVLLQHVPKVPVTENDDKRQRAMGSQSAHILRMPGIHLWQGAPRSDLSSTGAEQ